MEPTAAATTRLELADDWDSVNEQFIAEGWSDGLPIVPPTEDRVGRFVAASGRGPSAVVAALPPAMGVASVEKIAVNAVMAGCRPEYMPLLCAALEAIADPVFNGHTIQVSSNPVGVLVLVNGPIRRALEIAVGANCIFLYMTSILLAGRFRDIIIRLLGPAPDWLAGRFHTTREPWLAFTADWLVLATLVGMAVWMYRRRILIKI